MGTTGLLKCFFCLLWTFIKMLTFCNWLRMARFSIALVAIGVASGACSLADEWKSGIEWQTPPVVSPGEGMAPPSDAIVLFDGTDLSEWDGAQNWIVKDGYAQVNGGSITSKQHFGDCQLHIEWATPAKVEGDGQGRGNSGVFFMGRYELQVLDSFENPTYVDGQSGSLYKTKPPLVNASRKPGEWQVYDAIFTAPRFDEQGNLLRPGYLTAFHNGVLVQNHTEILGDTKWDVPPTYLPHGERGPFSLQDHGNPMRFRNIWVREIRELTAKRPAK
jgi:Domain of Unknown Function (DUF1080)